MVVTIIAILMIMAGYFLILYSAVALIQDKRFYTSAPAEVQAVIPEREERTELFPGARKVGWVVLAFAMVLFCGAFVLAIWDSVRNDYTFLQSFVRFLVMLYAMELYDIGFFDWVLLCHSNFYPAIVRSARTLSARSCSGSTDGSTSCTSSSISLPAWYWHCYAQGSGC